MVHAKEIKIKSNLNEIEKLQIYADTKINTPRDTPILSRPENSYLTMASELSSRNKY